MVVSRRSAPLRVCITETSTSGGSPDASSSGASASAAGSGAASGGPEASCPRTTTFFIRSASWRRSCPVSQVLRFAADSRKPSSTAIPSMASLPETRMSAPPRSRYSQIPVYAGRGGEMNNE